MRKNTFLFLFLLLIAFSGRMVIAADYTCYYNDSDGNYYFSGFSGTEGACEIDEPLEYVQFTGDTDLAKQFITGYYDRFSPEYANIGFWLTDNFDLDDAIEIRNLLPDNVSAYLYNKAEVDEDAKPTYWILEREDHSGAIIISDEENIAAVINLTLERAVSFGDANMNIVEYMGEKNIVVTLGPSVTFDSIGSTIVYWGSDEEYYGVTYAIVGDMFIASFTKVDDENTILNFDRSYGQAASYLDELLDVISGEEPTYEQDLYNYFGTAFTYTIEDDEYIEQIIVKEYNDGYTYKIILQDGSVDKFVSWRGEVLLDGNAKLEKTLEIALDKADISYSLGEANVKTITPTAEITAEEAIEYFQKLSGIGDGETVFSNDNEGYSVIKTISNSGDGIVVELSDDSTLADAIAVAAAMSGEENGEIIVRAGDNQVVTTTDTEGVVEINEDALINKTVQEIIDSLENIDKATVAVTNDNYVTQVVKDDGITVVLAEEYGQDKDHLMDALEVVVNNYAAYTVVIDEDPYIEKITITIDNTPVIIFKDAYNSVSGFVEWNEAVVAGSDYTAFNWFGITRVQAAGAFTTVYANINDKVYVEYDVASGMYTRMFAITQLSLSEVVDYYQQVHDALDDDDLIGTDFAFIDGDNDSIQSGCTTFDGSTCDLTPVVSVIGSKVAMDGDVAFEDLDVSIYQQDQDLIYYFTMGDIERAEIEVDGEDIDVSAYARDDTNLESLVQILQDSPIRNFLEIAVDSQYGKVLLGNVAEDGFRPSALVELSGDFFTIVEGVASQLETETLIIPQIIPFATPIFTAVDNSLSDEITIFTQFDIDTYAEYAVAMMTYLADELDDVVFKFATPYTDEFDSVRIMDGYGNFYYQTNLDEVVHMVEVVAEEQESGSFNGLTFSIVGNDFIISVTDGEAVLDSETETLSELLYDLDTIAANLPVVGSGQEILSDYDYTGTGVVRLEENPTGDGLLMTIPDDASLTDSQLNELFANYVTDGHENFTLSYKGETVTVLGRVIQRESNSYQTNTGHVSAGSNKNDGASKPSNENVPNNAQPRSCDKMSPVTPVEIFQIDRQGSDAKIWFNNSKDNVDGYSVIFGYEVGDNRFGGISIPAGENDGVKFIEIHDLDPNQVYSFQVMPTNGCAVGPRSNWLTAKGVNRGATYWSRTYRYTGK